MNGSGPLVSIVVPCRNERSEIGDMLDDILARGVGDCRLEVIVADGESDDGTREILARRAAEDSRLLIINNGKRIASAGLNAAIRAARGEIVIRMDCHTRYASDYITRCLEVLESTGADNVGGAWLAEGRSFWGRTIAAALQSRVAMGGARSRQTDYEGPVDTVYLGCWRKECFARYGYFDETLVRNQDDELNLRMRRAGAVVWQSPKIRSWYRCRESLRKLFAQYLQYGYWKVLVLKKHRTVASLRHLAPVVALAMLVALTNMAVFFSWAKPALAGALVVYHGALLLAAAVAIRRQPIAVVLAMPLAFATIHAAYACGYARGLVDVYLLRQGPTQTLVTLTR